MDVPLRLMIHSRHTAVLDHARFFGEVGFWERLFHIILSVITITSSRSPWCARTITTVATTDHTFMDRTTSRGSKSGSWDGSEGDRREGSRVKGERRNTNSGIRNITNLLPHQLVLP